MPGSVFDAAELPAKRSSTPSKRYPANEYQTDKKRLSDSSQNCLVLGGSQSIESSVEAGTSKKQRIGKKSKPDHLVQCTSTDVHEIDDDEYAAESTVTAGNGRATPTHGSSQKVPRFMPTANTAPNTPNSARRRRLRNNTLSPALTNSSLPTEPVQSNTQSPNIAKKKATVSQLRKHALATHSAPQHVTQSTSPPKLPRSSAKGTYESQPNSCVQREASALLATFEKSNTRQNKIKAVAVMKPRTRVEVEKRANLIALATVSPTDDYPVPHNSSVAQTSSVSGDDVGKVGSFTTISADKDTEPESHAGGGTVSAPVIAATASDLVTDADGVTNAATPPTEVQAAGNPTTANTANVSLESSGELASSQRSRTAKSDVQQNLRKPLAAHSPICLFVRKDNWSLKPIRRRLLFEQGNKFRDEDEKPITLQSYNDNLNNPQLKFIHYTTTYPNTDEIARIEMAPIFDFPAVDQKLKTAKVEEEMKNLLTANSTQFLKITDLKSQMLASSHISNDILKELDPDKNFVHHSLLHRTRDGRSSKIAFALYAHTKLTVKMELVPKQVAEKLTHKALAHLPVFGTLVRQITKKIINAAQHNLDVVRVGPLGGNFAANLHKNHLDGLMYMVDDKFKPEFKNRTTRMVDITSKVISHRVPLVSKLDVYVDVCWLRIIDSAFFSSHSVTGTNIYSYTRELLQMIYANLIGAQFRESTSKSLLVGPVKPGVPFVVMQALSRKVTAAVDHINALRFIEGDDHMLLLAPNYVNKVVEGLLKQWHTQYVQTGYAMSGDDKTCSAGDPKEIDYQQLSLYDLPTQRLRDLYVKEKNNLSYHDLHPNLTLNDDGKWEARNSTWIKLGLNNIESFSQFSALMTEQEEEVELVQTQKQRAARVPRVGNVAAGAAVTRREADVVALFTEEDSGGDVKETDDAGDELDDVTREDEGSTYTRRLSQNGYDDGDGDIDSDGSADADDADSALYNSSHDG